MKAGYFKRIKLILYLSFDTHSKRTDPRHVKTSSLYFLVKKPNF